jgi:hypothetical protein
MQAMVARCVRDVFVLSVELMSRHYRPETILRKAGLQLPNDPQQAQMAMQLLSRPLDHYRIDVESDSTVRADLTQQRGEMSEFLQGTAAFFSTMAPIIAQEPTAAAPVAEIYAAFTRQFSLGKQAEDAIDAMVQMAGQAGQEGEPKPEEQAMQMEMQKAQAEMQMKQAEMQMRQQQMQIDAQFRQAEIQLKASEMQMRAQELGLKERIADFEAIKAAAEIRLEQEQKRPVAIQ